MSIIKRWWDVKIHACQADSISVCDSTGPWGTVTQYSLDSLSRSWVKHFTGVSWLAVWDWQTSVRPAVEVRAKAKYRYILKDIFRCYNTRITSLQSSFTQIRGNLLTEDSYPFLLSYPVWPKVHPNDIMWRRGLPIRRNLKSHNFLLHWNIWKY